MNERHELRWGGFAGLGFVVLAAIATLLPGIPPSVTSSEGAVTSYVSDGRGQILLASLLWAAAAGLVIWFAAAFAEAIREREERSDVHMAILAGSVLVGTAVFMLAVGHAVLAYGADTRAALGTVVMFEGLAVGKSVIGIAAALPLTAAAVGLLRTHLMPDWLGYLAIVAAAVSVIGAFGIFFTEGALVPGGYVTALGPLLVAAVWIACVSGYMVREHLPQAAPRAMPQT